MNIENLQAGQKIKNYKALCELLDEPVKTGKSKQLQHKEFERFFTYEKQGNSYIIIKIFDTPKPKEDKRSEGNNSIYVKYIEDSLTDFLILHSNGKLVITQNQLYFLLGMVNQKYSDREFKKHLYDGNADFTE